MADSGRYGENPHVEPGFLVSDGMSGGTDFFFVCPCDCYPRRRRRKARKAAPVRLPKASPASEVPA